MSERTWPCHACSSATPGYELQILAGNWYCSQCIEPARAEYDSPEATAIREQREREEETEWERAAALPTLPWKHEEKVGQLSLF